MDKLIELIKKLVASNYFGSLEIHFENGKVTYLKKVQTIKLV